MMRFYYPMMEGFYLPDRTNPNRHLGMPLPWLKGTDRQRRGHYLYDLLAYE